MDTNQRMDPKFAWRVVGHPSIKNIKKLNIPILISNYPIKKEAENVHKPQHLDFIYFLDHATTSSLLLYYYR